VAGEHTHPSAQLRKRLTILFQVGYNWKYGRCSVKTLKGHTNGVTCLQLDDNILATGSYDATIKICMYSLQAHFISP
jgi:WD40 repeat protein